MKKNFNITCPKCNAEFLLTESFVQSMIGIALEDRLNAERKLLAQAAEERASEEFGARLRSVETELAEKDLKIQQAQAAELAVRKERRALEEQKRELELEVERRLHDERKKVREATMKEEEESFRLKLAEKDKVIGDMRQQVEELRRKSEQSSQQLQGEVLELALEERLKISFPLDQIEPVQKGRAGGDVIQRVIGPGGFVCGTILWESKRTKTWSDDWLVKNRQDQRGIGAQVGVIISTAMPKGIDTFDQIETVWVGTTACILPLAKALRAALIETALVKLATKGREGKMEVMYEYLTGPQFRQRVSAIVEACIAMHEDLNAEKRAFNRTWSKRQRHLELLMTSTAGMYGDLQGMVGKSMPEIQGLGLALLEGDSLER
ncbi:MAG: hypothetical protein JWO13_398 [Acidobacteriales bacterium]|nr:hypothetical protein [Terriglobales bacterium]